MQRLLRLPGGPHADHLSSIRRFWHLAAPCPPVKQAWIDLLGPEAVWELYGGTELQALTFISGDQWLTHPGSVGVVVAGRDEGARRRRQRVPARRGRRDLHAPGAGKRADLPLRRRHREEPRRLGLARRPRLLRRRRLPLSQRPPRRHVHRRRPQRLPRRDRVGAVRAPGCVVLLGRRRTRRRPGSGAARHRAGRRARRGGRHRVPGRAHRGIQGAAHRRVHRHPAARRRRQGPPVGGARRGHRATAGSGTFADRTIQRRHRTCRRGSPSAATLPGTATRPARS